MRFRRLGWGFLGTAALTVLGGIAGTASAGPPGIQQINAVVWALIVISVIGAVITYGVLAYSIWKFRDPKVKGRRYG